MKSNRHYGKGHAWLLGWAIAVAVLSTAPTEAADKPPVQTVHISVASAVKTFDGIGAVNGGGATAVLLKDYPEPQRSQIMDMVFRPMWGASVSTMLAEIPGDGNSTQGSMPSHSHWRGDFNPWRGYTWWVLREAVARNPQITLDATGWSAPAWVENIWSQDMADYYVMWLQALRHVHGMELDALGCHNEKGYSYDFAKALRRTMDENGFEAVRLHALSLASMRGWYNFFREHFPGKLYAISEFGNIPKVSAFWADGQYWSFLIPWWDNARTSQPGSADFNSTDHNNANIDYWKDALLQDCVITRDELPNFR